MNRPTEQELRLQRLWSRALDRTAEHTAFSEPMVATTMIAAAVLKLSETLGHAGMAQYLGRLAVSFHERAGGELVELLPGEESGGKISSSKGH